MKSSQTSRRFPGSQPLSILWLIATAIGLLSSRAFVLAETPAGRDLVTGTVAYLQRSALPPDAIIMVSMHDVTLADAPSKLIIDQRFPSAGRQVPVAFRLPYDAATVDPSHRYTLRATITSRGRLIFATTAAYPVTLGPGPHTVDMVLQPVSAGSAKPTAPTTSKPAGPATLDNTYWKLVELGGAPIALAPNKREAHLILRADHHHVAGTSGCNRLFGTYESGPDSALRLKVGGMTMLACGDGMMTQEKNFLEALKTVTSFRIDGDKLELRNGDQVLARFESRIRK